MALETIEIETAPAPDAAVIWLHGLGADGGDFAPIVPELNLPGGTRWRFVFPHAPTRPVTINAGAVMRAWYDIDPRRPLAGDAEIRASSAAIAALVADQRALGIDSKRIVLAGFSQGGVIALHLGLRFDAPLAGIMALSTYLHDPENLTAELTLENAEVPIFLAHGLADPMIPITRAVASREVLKSLYYRVEWHEYAMGHQVCLAEIRDIGRWLAAVLPPQGG